MKQYLIMVILGLLGGVVGSAITPLFQNPTDEQRIHDFYSTETAVMVSPHGLRKQLSHTSQDFILVDLRSNEEYNKEHIVTAINIPAYSDPDTSAYGDVERIVSSFQNLEQEHPHKDIIIYCYSMPCMTGRKIGKMLADHDVYVKELGVGWNEWRHFWTLWNLEHEWETTNVEDYVISGNEPGVYKGEPVIAPCTIGEFGC
jgi:rhodanese-related sulfurtransferase